VSSAVAGMQRGQPLQTSVTARQIQAITILTPGAKAHVHLATERALCYLYSQSWRSRES
jgi:hypothetical protein